MRHLHTPPAVALAVLVGATSLALLTSLSTTGCATAATDTDVDSGVPAIVIPEGDAGHEAGSGIIVIGDSGLPSVTVTVDSGGSGSGSGQTTTGTDSGTSTTPDASSFGTPDATSASGDSGGGTGSSCGFSSSVAACNTCLTTSCCSEASTCSSDTTCTACVSSGASTCSSNAAYVAFATCVNSDCATACGGSDAGSGSGTGTGTGTGTGSGGAPTTCAEADHAEGCCANGKNYYCASSTSTTLKSKTCSSGEVCTWSASDGYYACATGTESKADPSGTYPLACE